MGKRSDGSSLFDRLINGCCAESTIGILKGEFNDPRRLRVLCFGVVGR